MAPVAPDGDRAKALHDLTLTPGWQELRQVYEDQRDRWAKHLAHQLLTDDAPIPQRMVDAQRGYFAAFKAILNQPDQAEKRFEKALRKTGET